MEFEQCTMNLSDWIKQEEAESGETAFYTILQSSA